MHQRISDDMLRRLIDGRGTTDGLTPPSAQGAERLALDLQDARATLDELHERLRAIGATAQYYGDEPEGTLNVVLHEADELAVIAKRGAS